MRSTCVSRALSPQIAPGTRVSCAYRAGHTGVALAIDDVRAWIGSLAFPAGEPSPADVAMHIAWCRSQGFTRHLLHSTPVLWPWGVMWDHDLTAL